MNTYKRTIYLLFFACFALFVNPAEAVIAVQKKSEAKTLSKKKTKKEKIRFFSRMKGKVKSSFTKIKKWAKARVEVIDFSDPVKKWLWFGLLFLAAALTMTIILAIIPGLNYLIWITSLLGTAGIVCLVIWLVRLLT